MPCFLLSCRWTYLSESERSGMAILEVTVPSGYFLHQKRLDDYVKHGEVTTLRRARYFPEKVIFYFDYVSYYAVAQCISESHIRFFLKNILT